MGQRLDQWRLYNNADFQGIVSASLIAVANALETADPATTPRYAQRAAIARRIRYELAIGQPGEYMLRFIGAAAFNANIFTQAYAGGSLDPSRIADSAVDAVIKGAGDVFAEGME